MKKTKLAVTLAAIALSAIPLMAQEIINTSAEVTALGKQIAQGTIDVVKSDVNRLIRQDILQDLETIKKLNTEYNSFLEFMEQSDVLGNENPFAAQRIITRLDDLGKTVNAIQDHNVKNAYAKTIKLVKYNFAYTGEPTSIEKLAGYSYVGGGLINFPGAELLASRAVSPKEIADHHAIKKLTTQHNKFLDFMAESANLLKDIAKEAVAQRVLMEIDDLGIEVKNLPDGAFKDSYIKTLNSIQYYFAYNNHVLTLTELADFGFDNVKSVYTPGLLGVKALLSESETFQKTERTQQTKNKSWLYDAWQGIIETFQHEK